jgi:hypothetical protein
MHAGVPFWSDTVTELSLVVEAGCKQGWLVG